MAQASESASRFKIFRARDAVDPEKSGHLVGAPLSPIEQAGAEGVIEAGIGEGSTLRLLFEAPGMSLSYAWFRSGYPLPRHSHDSDCLYFILAGSLVIGAETLGPGDGFLVGANVPYTYKPGEAGVEVLEFRAVAHFGIKVMADSPAFWARAAETVRERRALWAKEKPPSGMKM